MFSELWGILRLVKQGRENAIYILESLFWPKLSEEGRRGEERGIRGRREAALEVGRDPGRQGSRYLRAVEAKRRGTYLNSSSHTRRTSRSSLWEVTTPGTAHVSDHKPYPVVVT
jgi:hypothetical protein